MPKKALIVDDERDIVELVAHNLAKEGFLPLKAYDGEAALQITEKQKPDIIILDLMLPGLSGLEVCKAINRHPDLQAVPIIMLTAKGEEVDRVLGLEMGADDYITKPFSVRELMARVRAVLRRAETTGESRSSETFEYKNLRADFRSYEIAVDGKKVDLGPMEMKLLKFLTGHPGRVYSREQLLDCVWGDESFVEPRTVDVHISRLRAAIEKDNENPQYVLTVRGIGYKFVEVK
jgi:phosphate regulon transcriptional regulator PhoB